MMVKIFTFLPNIPLGILLLLLATIVFDLLHVCLHCLARSSNHILKKVGALHTVHHQFLDTDLKIHEDLIVSNAFRHVIPEFLVQLAVTMALMPFFPLAAVCVALAIELAVFVFIMWGKPGFDVNHKHVEKLNPYKPLYFCVPEYHLLHHVYPVAYFSSWIKTLDHLLCTGTALQGRRVLLTDAQSDFSKTIAAELGHAGAKIHWLDSEGDMATDILVLCHDPKTDSDYKEVVEKFIQVNQNRRLPVEVWALVSETEFADVRFSGYAKFAKQLFGEGRVIYRHLVADGYRTDAAKTRKLFAGICRGFNYVPASFNLAMLKHYWQFVFK